MAWTLLDQRVVTKLRGILWQSIVRTYEDDAFELCAAIAYYSLLSMAPLLLIAIAVAGIFFADGAVHAELIRQVETLVGAEGAALTQTVIESTQSEERSRWSLVVGAVLTLLGATTVFAQLQNALNRVWRVKAAPGNALLGFIKHRILSFALVLAHRVPIDGVVVDQRLARRAAHLSRQSAFGRDVVLGHARSRDHLRDSRPSSSPRCSSTYRTRRSRGATAGSARS